VGDPGERFREDYLRILRALRFAARFDFQIEPATWEAARAAAPGLARLSAERVRDEWFKSLRTAQSIERLVSLWVEVGAAQGWIPGLQRDTATSVRKRTSPGERDPILLTALLSTAPSLVLRRLKASNAEIERVLGMERGPEEPAGPDERSVRRWLARVGASADDLMSLWAYRRGGAAPWSSVAAEIRRRGDPLSRADLAVNGSDIQGLGLAGPQVGRVLTELLERVLDRPELNTRDALLRLAGEIR
jgi:tRNA nucleotidyltransferase (CCA-adding enzyme)